AVEGANGMHGHPLFVHGDFPLDTRESSAGNLAANLALLAQFNLLGDLVLIEDAICHVAARRRADPQDGASPDWIMRMRAGNDDAGLRDAALLPSDRQLRVVLQGP